MNALKFIYLILLAVYASCEEKLITEDKRP